jgi:FkbM family methyltransferase
MMNRFLSLIDIPPFRGFLKLFIFLNYIRKGHNIKQVKYFHEFKKWYYKINDISFFSTAAGWAYSYNFLLSEMKNISCFAYTPKEGDIVIDLGAGIGEETIIFSKLIGTTGRVYSIEAHPETFKSLKYIVEDNKLDNVFLFNGAISDNDGIVKIENNNDSYLGNSILNQGNKANFIEVSSLKMDSFVKSNNIKRVDFLKVNIEGAEQLIIKGMDDFVNRLENGAISCHDFRYQNGEEEFYKTKEIVVNYFKSKGFNVLIRQTGNSLLDNYVYISRRQ